jgi:hypothetical protein
MHSTRHARPQMPGGSRCAAVWFCALLTILLCLPSIFFPGCPAVLDSQGQTSAVRRDSISRAMDTDEDSHRVQASLASPLATPPSRMALMVQGLFSLPADTESTDTETALSKLSHPVILASFCFTRAKWQPTTIRRVSTPIYLYHQSLLC